MVAKSSLLEICKSKAVIYWKSNAKKYADIVIFQKFTLTEVYDQGISGSQKSILIGFTGPPNTDSCSMAVIMGNVLN